MSVERLTIPDAIRKLFGIDVAKESPLLKNKANSLVRNGLIKTETELIVHRKSVYLAKGQEIVLFNALLLNAVFPDPKDVKKVFFDTDYRQKAAITAKSVLLENKSLMGVAISHPDTRELISCLEGAFDLFNEKLPNPFQMLPQVALGGEASLLHALLAQAASLSPADGLFFCFLKGDIAEANRLAQKIEADTPELNALKNTIESKYREAQEFDFLLDQFREM